ncbi:unnamed protein product [Schistocephalus solidus]|uniref:PBP_domain domain-containing protein n=1 Tax=Schistocephalus solidus TaxID=70667 RepID=A0A183TJ80_SCHSO|nr:unnamed protein product [Schistocephalus solidus]
MVSQFVGSGEKDTAVWAANYLLLGVNSQVVGQIDDTSAPVSIRVSATSSNLAAIADRIERSEVGGPRDDQIAQVG